MNVTDVPASVVMRDHRGKAIALLVPRSPERKAAEAVRALREKGVTMNRISAETHLSIATLRRMLNRLSLTEAVEAGKHDKAIRAIIRETRAAERAAHPARRHQPAA
jgi:hypothetical protein